MAHALSPQAQEQAIVVALLGGLKTLGSPRASSVNYIDLVRAGLPFRSFRTVTDALALTLDVVATSLGLSPRTLHRRKAERLTAIESERVMRLARVAARAELVLGDREAALDWLKTPNRALDDATPLSLLDTDIGTDDVLEVLTRIQFSIYT